MSVKVVKFGGSSLADAQQFKKVKDIVLSDPERRFVVPSAPGKRFDGDEKVTDMLYACQSLAQKGESFDGVFDRIVQRFVDIESDLGLSTNIAGHLEIIRREIANGATADYAASRGEYLNGILLSAYLGFEFVDAKDLVKFDENGVFLAEYTNEIAAEALKSKKSAVIPGFYGSMPNGEIKTFSRGGSDISGAIIARCVFADVYENWTDVSGFLMADPRIVKNPDPIRVVTYGELRELAYMGATVLHEESIFPVRQACIPINVRNTNAPEEMGTMIVPEAEDYSECAITGIAGRKGFAVINIEKDKMNVEVGFAYRVLSALVAHNISIEHMPTGIDTLSVIISQKDLEGRRSQVIDDIIAACNPDSVEVHEDMALIAVVGRGMINRVGTSAKVFTALAEHGVNVRMIDQGSSEINIIIGIESHEFEAAVNAIYSAFRG
ncbi:MAG: aspartate kinase [Christensenellales bacterium]|jgi:aspartate kinase